MQVLSDFKNSDLSVLIKKFNQGGYPDISFEKEGLKNNVNPLLKNVNLRFRYLKELAKFRKIQDSVSHLQQVELSLNKLSNTLDDLKRVGSDVMESNFNNLHDELIIFQSLYSVYKDMSKLSKDFPKLNSLIKSIKNLNDSISSSYGSYVNPKLDIQSKVYRVSFNIDVIKNSLKNNLNEIDEEVSKQMLSNISEPSAYKILESIKSRDIPYPIHNNLDANSVRQLLN